MLNSFISKIKDAYYIDKFPNKSQLQRMSPEDIVELVNLLKKDCVANFDVRMQQNQFMTNLALELTHRLEKELKVEKDNFKEVGVPKKSKDKVTTYTGDLVIVGAVKKLFSDPIEIRAAIIISEHLGIEPDKIRLSSHFVEDLGADSLDLAGLVIDFEEEFEIGDIPDDDAEQIETFEQAVKYIKDNIKDKD